jgi:cytochrome c
MRPTGPGKLLEVFALATALPLALTFIFALTPLLAQTQTQTPPAPAPAATAAVREWHTPPPGDVQRGLALYQERCIACHAVDSNKIGPAHRGVVGRRVGSLPGYKYSDELARSRLRWTPQTLNAWLEDPEELVAGQRMGFQVENAQERADLIAYLITLK